MHKKGLPWQPSGYESMLPIKGVWVQSLDLEDPLEKEMATHCSILSI